MFGKESFQFVYLLKRNKCTKKHFLIFAEDKVHILNLQIQEVHLTTIEHEKLDEWSLQSFFLLLLQLESSKRYQDFDINLQHILIDLK